MVLPPLWAWSVGAMPWVVYTSPAKPGFGYPYQLPIRWSFGGGNLLWFIFVEDAEDWVMCEGLEVGWCEPLPGCADGGCALVGGEVDGLHFTPPPNGAWR